MSLNLDESLYQKIKSEQTAANNSFNNSHAEGMEIKTNSVADLFAVCQDSINYNDAQQDIFPLTRMGTLGIIDYAAKKPVRILRYVSSKEFGEAFFNNNYINLQAGYYLEWYYLEAPASVVGKCLGPGYEYAIQKFKPSSTEYNLKFKPGWNLVKTEVISAITDKNGNTTPLEMRYTTLNKIPDDVYLLVKTR